MEKIAARAKPVFFLLLVCLIFSCWQFRLQKAQAAGVYHLVKKHETVWSIARAYGVSVQGLVTINHIDDVNQIEEGSVLFIPSAERVIDDTANIKKEKADEAPQTDIRDSGRTGDEKNSKKAGSKKIAAEAAPVKTGDLQDSATAKIRDDKPTDPQNKTVEEMVVPNRKIKATHNKFLWPVQGEIKAHFGIQPNKTFHNWVKIVSASGKKIKAAESGTVIFSSHLKNYGETIIIRHKDHFATVYTHLKKRLVKMDTPVKKGEAIAVLGEKDDDGAVYMNFEVRLKGKAVNPLSYLP
ncbi:MAG TPA: M23 family metallopeptidase [Smithella sp.]|nr:M23 family metallopeptidase [Smithella sp.]HOX99162.1 M23 family metallopeptidase [Smithella sp.]